ncbi:MAG: hypothetical protein NC517_12590 [Firmicutes bacterium]|nr:hypothetical protein [Bacillota bacterium]
MKRIKKRFWYLTLFFCLVLNLAACASSADPEVSSSAPEAEVTATPAPEPTQETETVDSDYPEMKYTGYYTNDKKVIAAYKSYLRDSEVYLSDSAEGQQEIADMEQRIQEIVNSPTEIVKADEYVQGVSYSGTAYYVDPESGNDDNAGTSPEKAFRSVARLNGGWLQEGDAVFLKRGSVFYGGELELQDGVTYSAYGEGRKPILTASPATANDPAYWELYSDADGRKIWHFLDRRIGSVGWIDFDLSDDKYAYPVYEYWSEENGYQHINTVHVDYSEFKPGEGLNRDRYGELVTMSIEEQLTENLTFISRTNGFKDEENGIVWCMDVLDTDLYLRCDEGNPAEVFETVKLTTAAPMGPDGVTTTALNTYGRENVTLDNIEVSNGVQYGIGHMSHSTIQNCEVSFIGNHVWNYTEWRPENVWQISINYIGDGIYNCVNGGVVKNNYVHHTCCVGITGEHYTSPDSPIRGDAFGPDLVEHLDAFIADSNVVAYTGVGIAFQEGDEWVGLDMDDIVFSNNYVAYVGEQEGVLRWQNDFNGTNIYSWDSTNQTDVIKFIASHHIYKNNTFIGGYGSSMMSTVDGWKAIKTFEGNTFVGDAMDNAVIDYQREIVIKYWQMVKAGEEGWTP